MRAVRSHATVSGDAVVCLTQIAGGDLARSREGGDVDEVTPARVGSAPVDRGDDLLGQHHVVGVAAQSNGPAEEQRDIGDLRFGQIGSPKLTSTWSAIRAVISLAVRVTRTPA